MGKIPERTVGECWISTISHWYAACTLLSKPQTAQKTDFVVLKGSGARYQSNTVKRSISSDAPKIKEFIVKTVVANRFAETNVLSKVENEDNQAKQTTFSVVLPERALISGFSMEIDGQTYKAFVIEKEEANKLYGQSVAGGQTAAHVSVSTRNSNRFLINVNVEPESKVNFHLTYEELLQREKGQYEIITNIQPGQIVKMLQVQVEIKENTPLLFVRTPSLRSGNVLIENNARLDPEAKIKIYNTSAKIEFHPDVNRQLKFACAGLGNKEYGGFAGQFVVQYDVERDVQGGETLFQDGFFINYFAPPNLEPIPKHIVFVLDTSGSMEGIKITQLKEAMMGILPQLFPEDLFNIVQYEYAVYLWDLKKQRVDVIPSSPRYGNLSKQLEAANTLPPAVAATKENIEIAKEIVNYFEAYGTTNSIGALEVGLHLIGLVQESYPNKYQPVLIFLTDGLPNVGIDKPAEIVSVISGINSREYNTPIYSLCVGDDADWNFLNELSLSSNGKATRIYLDPTNPDVSVQLQDFYETISTPVLNNLTFNDLPPSTQVTRLKFPIFFNGSEITIAGKGASKTNVKPIKISGKGKQGNLEFETKIGIPLTRLERIWAYLLVRQLLDESQTTITITGSNTELKTLALDIALNYSLVTDVTSLIVVKPNSSNSAVDLIDASKGIFRQSSNELPMCNNITGWIITNFGTPEPTTTEIIVSTTTDFSTTFPKPSTVTTYAATTSPFTTTEEDNIILERDFHIQVPTILPMPSLIPLIQKTITACNDTPFGCCYDGVTPATGFNFSGCDPVPKSESCSLSESEGKCTKASMTKWSLKWSYSSTLGACHWFWYSGCAGNDNRFGSKEDCEKVCVDVQGPERCKLPIILTRCNRQGITWFFDQRIGDCTKLPYAGCTGNSNRFSTKQECLQSCGAFTKATHTVVSDVCQLSPEGGTCRDSLKRWYFNKAKNRCKQFVYSGCGGNQNNFNSKKECHQRCFNRSTENLQESCALNYDHGPCNNLTEKWTYSQDYGNCVRFWYGGCGGNDNRFESKEACSDICINPPGRGMYSQVEDINQQRLSLATLMSFPIDLSNEARSASYPKRQEPVTTISHVGTTTRVKNDVCHLSTTVVSATVTDFLQKINVLELVLHELLRNMYSSILIFVCVWHVGISRQTDFVVLRSSNTVESNIVKRSVSTDDLPKIEDFIVKTVVANRFAETTILSTVSNDAKQSKQTTFSVVLPERALISGFSMEIDGATYKAFVIDKEIANKLYGQSVSNGQTAAHVSISTRDSNRFLVDVNVEPESKVTFRLAYQELLQREKGRYEIVTNIQPGQVVKNLQVQVEIKENRPLLFVRTPTLRSGNVQIENNTQLLNPDAVIDISNTSAKVEFYPDVYSQLEFACAGLGNKEFDGFAGQFVVQYDIDRDPQGGETLYQDGFFINFFAPPNLEPIPKHIVFVLDTSGSMGGVKISQLKDAMASILPQLLPEDLLNIVQFESAVYLWDSNKQSVSALPASPQYGNLAQQLKSKTLPPPVAATKDNIKIATETVNSFVASGGTNIMGGLEVGLYLIRLVQEATPKKYQPVLIFLTDGLPNGGIDDPTRIVTLISDINSKEYNTPIYSLSVGTDADWNFIRELSLSSNGISTRVYVDAANTDVSSQLQDFYDTIATPVLNNITFNNLPPSTQWTRLKFPIFFNGSEITIAGRGGSSNNVQPIKISANGKQGPVEFETAVEIPLTRLERIWAYLFVKLLEESETSVGTSNKTELDRLALEVSMQYSLVTNVTSLVVVKPNGNNNSVVDLIDASEGILRQSADGLPMCGNITDWIISNFGTPEPTTTETTTELSTTTETPPCSGNTTTAPGPPKPCSCQNMPFGCCSDGVTPAIGPNFSGCDPIPKPESCSLPECAGRCKKPLITKWSLKWSYNSELGECRQFWYSGCEGNGNRFGSKHVCEKNMRPFRRVTG
ncbi:hypothetical protein NQ315_007155 [Exocentrus adspersus]|uniref:Uncharacterized protein n=1 Tax=Exocentrus adspersus TaxID=1586481 RepID=A0AAV8WCV6_9CUCU|nr:hypothetical protein NQ315_007155 [Exocentrus adspersus]